MPRAAIEDMQQQTLLQVLPYAYARAPMIRQLWDQAGVTPGAIRNLEDFRQKVPFTNKDMIRQFRDRHNDPYGGLLCVTTPRLRVVGLTSGTTGAPTPVPFSHSPTTDPMKRDLWHIGMRPGDYMTMNMFTFREGHCTTDYTDVDFRPLTFQHSPLSLPRIFAATERYRPRTMFTVSTPLLMAMEDYAEKHAIDMKAMLSSYKGLVFGGEAPAPRLRKLVQSWDVELFEITSLGDVAAAIDCSAHDGFHAWEDRALIECLDPQTGEPVADGERGELVVTSLQDAVAPLIRYRTDDLVTLQRETCRCGRTHARIKVLGRLGDELLIDGQSILPRDITPLMEHFPETRDALYQVIRSSRQMPSLKLRVGYNPERLQDTTGALTERLTAALKQHFAVPVTVELVLVSELLKLGPPHKIPRVAKH
jgi:phenylacetate-CoA ligase